MKLKKLREILEKEIAEQTEACERDNWINDEGGMWMQGRLKGLQFALYHLKPEGAD